MKIVYAKSFKDRLLGLMFKRNIDIVMKFERCNSIHTFFMKSQIDVYFADKQDIVLHVYRNLKPNKIILPRKDAFAVFETAVGLWDYKVGDKIKD